MIDNNLGLDQKVRHIRISFGYLSEKNFCTEHAQVFKFTFNQPLLRSDYPDCLVYQKKKSKINPTVPAVIKEFVAAEINKAAQMPKHTACTL